MPVKSPPGPHLQIDQDGQYAQDQDGDQKSFLVHRGGKRLTKKAPCREDANLLFYHFWRFAPNRRRCSIASHFVLLTYALGRVGGLSAKPAQSGSPGVGSPGLS